MGTQPTISELIESLRDDGGIAVVIGARGTGKTYQVKRILVALAEVGITCGWIDSNVGQSDVGPPTTLGLAMIKQPADVDNPEPFKLWFVGRTHPKGRILPAVIGVGRLTQAAFEAGAKAVIVDTSGLIEGEIGRELKQSKLELLSANWLLALGGRELAHIIGPYQGSGRPVVVQLEPAENREESDKTELRRTRALGFKRHFAGAVMRRIPLPAVGVFGGWLSTGRPLKQRELRELREKTGLDAGYGIDGPDSVQLYMDQKPNTDLTTVLSDGRKVIPHDPAELEGCLVACLDEHRFVLALGVIQHLDTRTQMLEVVTALSDDQMPASIEICEVRIDPETGQTIEEPEI